MFGRLVFIFFLTIVASSSFSAEVATVGVEQWPSWRGPDGTGVVREGKPPIEWSETKNVKWKTTLPGVGQSTPIIWGDKIFLQTAVAVGKDTGEAKSFFFSPPSKDINVPYRFMVLCLNRENGAIIWKRVVHEVLPHEGHHPSGSLAPYTPVTDGKLLWASFGSRGLYCLDFEGNIQWKAKTTKMNKARRYGEGSSPALAEGAVFLLADHEGQSNITAYDKLTGKIRWQVDREEKSSWSTPTVVKVADRTEIITSASKYIRSYDAKTGELVWKCAGLTGCAAPSPVVYDGTVFCTTGFLGSAILAIKLGNRGDLTGTDALLWSRNRAGSNVPTPLAHNSRLYVFESYRASLSCLDTATGEPHYERQRLPGMKNVYASPLAVGNNIYLCDREGTTVVIKSSDQMEILATNHLDENLDASPVAIGDELYLRGRSSIYCISESK